MSRVSVPVREDVAMEYVGTSVRPTAQSREMAVTADSASQDSGESQSMSELPSTRGRVGSSASL